MPDNAPTPHSSPSKKRVRSVGVEDPIAFHLPEIGISDRPADDQATTPPTTPRSSTPHPSSPPPSRCATPSSDGESVHASGDTKSVPESSTPGPSCLPVSTKNSKITSFWKPELAAEKEERLHREFAKLREDAEKNDMETAHLKRLKLGRKRVGQNERQEKHRTKVREERMESGWVPGKKRVSHSSSPV